MGEGGLFDAVEFGVVDVVDVYISAIEAAEDGDVFVGGFAGAIEGVAVFDGGEGGVEGDGGAGGEVDVGFEGEHFGGGIEIHALEAVDDEDPVEEDGGEEDAEAGDEDGEVAEEFVLFGGEHMHIL